MSPVEMFFGMSLLVVPLLFASTFLADRSFRRDLRTRHPMALAALDLARPNALRRTDSLRFQRFLWASEYRKLEDAELNRRAGWLKGLTVTYTASFLLVLIVLMTQVR